MILALDFWPYIKLLYVPLEKYGDDSAHSKHVIPGEFWGSVVLNEHSNIE